MKYYQGFLAMILTVIAFVFAGAGFSYLARAAEIERQREALEQSDREQKFYEIKQCMMRRFGAKHISFSTWEKRDGTRISLSNVEACLDK